MRIDLSDLDRLESFADALARLFYCLMVVAFFAAILGSAGTGLFLLILGAAAFVVRAGLEDFVASRGERAEPPESKADEDTGITIYRARGGRAPQPLEVCCLIHRLRPRLFHRNGLAAAAGLLGVLLASLAVAAAPSAAGAALNETESDTAPIREYDGVMLSAITGPQSPERFPLRIDLARRQELRQVSPTEVEVVYTDGTEAFVITAEKAHAADGAKVPTSLEMTGEDMVTLVVPHRAGNPAAGGAPFDYPITAGEGWEGGQFQTVIVQGPPDETELREMSERERIEREIIEASPAAQVEPPPVDHLQGADAARLLPARREEPPAGGALRDRRGPPRGRDDPRQGQGREAVPRRRDRARGRGAGRGEARGEQRMKLRGKMLAATTFLCALVASLAIAVAPAAAEFLGPAPIRNWDEGGMVLPTITGPEAPEEYPFRVDLGEEQFLRQVSATEVDAYYAGHSRAFAINAEAAHDAVGAAVPTTLELTGRDVVTLTVHHREGNPAAAWAPFDYPVVGGSGWPGGFQTIVVEMKNPLGEPGQTVIEANPPASTEPAPVPICKVPSLRGDSLRGAKNRLRAAHCGIGAVHLAAGATLDKGKVVKQFHAAGTELAAGAPIAVKIGGSGG